MIGAEGGGVGGGGGAGAGAGAPPPAAAAAAAEGGWMDVLSPLFGDGERFGELLDDMVAFCDDIVPASKRHGQISSGLTVVPVLALAEGSDVGYQQQQGWSLAIGAALAARYRAGLKPFTASTAFGLHQRAAASSAGGPALLCAACVCPGFPLAEAVEAIERSGFTVLGLTCLRLDEDGSNQDLGFRFPIHARSRGVGGALPAAPLCRKRVHPSSLASPPASGVAEVRDGILEQGKGHGHHEGSKQEMGGVSSRIPVLPRHSSAVLEANDPCEDRHCEILRPDLGLAVYCVADGHGGDLASQFVMDRLAQSVMSKLEEGIPSPDNDESEMKALLHEEFVKCDEDFIGGQPPLQPGDEVPRKSYHAGCCVLLAAYLPGARLIVAHVGDCRAIVATYNPSRFTKPIMGGRSQTRRLTAVPLTIDHTCDHVGEANGVRARSSDPNPIRCSGSSGNQEMMRVGGSLVVTRAIGDAYLKDATRSRSPHKHYVPYITCEPQVSAFRLLEQDRYLILASDGVWERCTNADVVSWVSKSPTAQGVIDGLICKIVKARPDKFRSREDLFKMEMGKPRRIVFDDSTATVIELWPGISGDLPLPQATQFEGSHELDLMR